MGCKPCKPNIIEFEPDTDPAMSAYEGPPADPTYSMEEMNAVEEKLRESEKARAKLEEAQAKLQTKNKALEDKLIELMREKVEALNTLNAPGRPSRSPTPPAGTRRKLIPIRRSSKKEKVKKKKKDKKKRSFFGRSKE
mmetsp:Transcript_19391/g.34627  ORF Transcript_19391/g.34627 Transcript_19391/m.34627 type:complete len:138 (+) Transcript_19391:198-611(+)|eukprot:CAMPEP_0197516578 /NCGR_PEP_ID=MMETSP1318-20131121/1482_1 /TAXON_ID=552666 /ORGANISM="Partenskyella glossopodia, Strain RCC365" /LENGTH=137 /DNA_ID=CAMNT_0043065435 /DNA_START=193 /DNA_END=606 /DNA_ORIENTATION=-